MTILRNGFTSRLMTTRSFSIAALVVSIVLFPVPSFADSASDRDDEFYDALRDQIYEADWTDDLCGRVEAFYTYIEGLELKLAQIDRLIAHKEEQVAQAGSDKTRRALLRELTRLYDKHDDQIMLIMSTYRDSADAATAQPGVACDIPNLYFVGDGVEPPMVELPPAFGTEPRPLAALLDQNGRESVFITNEIVVEKAIAADVAARWGGSIATNIPAAMPGGPELSLVIVDTSGVEISNFGDLAGLLTETRGGVIEVSSEEGLAMLAVAAIEATAGNVVGVNWVAEPHSYADMVLREDPDGDGLVGWTDLPGRVWSDNPYDWIYLKSGSELDMGVSDAWTLMDDAGKLSNKIGLGILDGGFYPEVNEDFPPGFRTFSVVGATEPLNTNGLDPSLPYHGTSVLNMAAAAADNGIGTIGTGSPVADTFAIFTSYDMFATVVALDQGRIAGVKVANMSYGMWLPASFEWSLLPFELALRTLHLAGLVMITSAGNDGSNIDAGTCLFETDFCWEESVSLPCELGDMYCIGALLTYKRQKAGYSNYGDVPQWGGKGDADDQTVNLFAPGGSPVGPVPGRPNMWVAQGTSLASPYVAGVAALVWAADPNQSSQDIIQRLHDTGTKLFDAEGERDEFIKLVIEPMDAVVAALNDACPCISIKYPEDGDSFSEGAAITPRASSYDGLATLTSANWVVRRDSDTGPVEASGSGLTGPAVPVIGGGSHVFILTTNFDDGSVVTEQVTVSYVNIAPMVEILSPFNGAVLTDNEIVSLRARATDVGYPDGLPDANVNWFLDDILIPIASGSDTTVSFAGTPLDWHTLRVEVTDGYETASDSVGIQIVAGGANAPPSIVIGTPSDGDIIYGTPDGTEWEALIDLRAVVSDPDGDVLFVEWFVSKDGGPLQYIGPGQQILNVPFRINSCFGSTFTIRATVSDRINTDRADTVAIQVRGSEIC